jgi:hypothetical protein
VCAQDRSCVNFYCTGPEVNRDMSKNIEMHTKFSSVNVMGRDHWENCQWEGISEVVEC